MPTRNEIQQRVHDLTTGAVDQERRLYLAKLREATGRNVLIYASCIGNFSGAGTVNPGLTTINQDDIHGFMAALKGLKGKELDLIIHSPGGSPDATEQIVNYLRAKFDYIRAIIPQCAMSAATMLACACDQIVMGKQSAIGPTDPQFIIPNAAGQLISMPAQAILDEFTQAKEEVLQNPKLAAIWIPKLQLLPPGLLKRCEAARMQSTTRVADWLHQFMKLNKEKALEVAVWLAAADEHHAHGRPISIKMAQEQGLNVTALEDDQDLQELVLSVFHATTITFERTRCVKVIENHEGKGIFVSAKGKQG